MVCQPISCRKKCGKRFTSLTIGMLPDPLPLLERVWVRDYRFHTGNDVNVSHGHIVGSKSMNGQTGVVISLMQYV